MLGEHEPLVIEGFAVEIPGNPVKWLQYSPITGEVQLVTTRERNRQAGLIMQHIASRQSEWAKQYRPFGSAVVLRLGLACDKACSFCFEGVKGKDRGQALSSQRAISPEAVKAVFQAIAMQADFTGQRYIQVKITGGEPTLFPALIKLIVQEVRSFEADPKNPLEKCLLVLETAGNFGATLSSALIQKCFDSKVHYQEFLAENIDIVRVSFDGLPEIQAKTRPGDDAEAVAARIAWMCKTRQQISSFQGESHVTINCVVQPEYISKMEESAAYMLRNFPGSVITFSPVTGMDDQSLQNFFEMESAVIDALRRRDKHRIMSRVENANPNRIAPCGRNGDAVEVIPAYGSGRHGVEFFTCPLATSQEHVKEETRIGDWNISNKGEITWDKPQIEKNRQLGFAPHCVEKQCPALWSCGGGCPESWVKGVPRFVRDGVCDQIVRAMFDGFLRDITSSSSQSDSGSHDALELVQTG